VRESGGEDGGVLREELLLHKKDICSIPQRLQLAAAVTVRQRQANGYSRDTDLPGVRVEFTSFESIQSSNKESYIVKAAEN
jgi:hypothetical protein